MSLPEEVKIFLLESFENLDLVEAKIVELEQHVEDAALINSIFRAIHTIKGNSGFLGFSNLERLCHRGESLLDRVRSGRLPLSDGLVSVLLECADRVRELLQTVEELGREGEVETESIVSEMEKFLQQAA